MTTASAVISICKERNLAVSYIEQRCGFSNGYLKKLKGDLPLDKLRLAAACLDVPTEYIEGYGKHEIMDNSPLDYNNIARMYPDKRMIFDYAISSNPEDLRFIASVFSFLRSKNQQQAPLPAPELPALPSPEECDSEEIYKNQHSNFALTKDYSALSGTSDTVAM